MNLYEEAEILSRFKAVIDDLNLLFGGNKNDDKVTISLGCLYLNQMFLVGQNFHVNFITKRQIEKFTLFIM